MRAGPSFHWDVGEEPRLEPERRAGPSPLVPSEEVARGGDALHPETRPTAIREKSFLPGGSSLCTAAPAGTRGRARRSMTRLAPQRYVGPDSGSLAAATARALHPGRRARTSSDSGSVPCRSRTRALPPRSAEQPCCRDFADPPSELGSDPAAPISTPTPLSARTMVEARRTSAGPVGMAPSLGGLGARPPAWVTNRTSWACLAYQTREAIPRVTTSDSGTGLPDLSSAGHARPS
jgi:hypothetical protein